MAKKSDCNCGGDAAQEDTALYVVYDDASDELVAQGIKFGEIEGYVSEYLNDNGYDEDDVDFTVYREAPVSVEIQVKPKITVVRK